MKRVLSGILLFVYSIIAITVTVLLLSYNDYNCSEIGGYTVFIVNDDSLEPNYKQGSILLIKSTSDKNVQIGDEIFLYKVLNSQEYELVNRTLLEKTQQGRHITYAVEDEERYATDYFVGKASDTIVIEGWGYVLGLLESKWGYLFCVVIVSLLLFLQEVFELVMEIKYGREEKKNNNEEAEKTAKSTNEVTPKKNTKVTSQTTPKKSTKATSEATPKKNTKVTSGTTSKRTTKASSSKIEEE